MILALVVAVLACAALAYVVAPMKKGARPSLPRPSSVEDALARKDAALSALVDIEDEREIGKLSPADFEMLRRQYEAEAVRALRELDVLQEDAEMAMADEELEEEIAQMRVKLACPVCGALRTEGLACERCGA